MNEKAAPKRTLQLSKKILTEVFLLMFGLPAALSFIAKFDGRLDMAPLLERIVLNFEKVSLHTWSVVLEKIRIDAIYAHSILSFLTLMALPAGIQVLRKWWPHRSRSKDPESSRGAIRSFEVWHSVPGHFLSVVIAGAYFAVILEAFDILGTLLLPPMPIYFFLILVLFYSESWMRSIGAPKRYIARIAHFSRQALFAIPVTLIFFGLSIWKDMKENMYSSAYNEEMLGIYLSTNLDGNLLMVLLVILPYTLLGAISLCRIAFTYVALWAAGIYIVNWIATRLVPDVSRFLEEAGA